MQEAPELPITIKLWLSNEKILIIGSQGYLGSRLVDYLSDVVMSVRK